MKFSKISGRVSKILRRDLEFWERVLWNFKLWKLAPLFLRGTLRTYASWVSLGGRGSQTVVEDGLRKFYGRL